MASSISGIILAGGKGSRMNHANKGLQLLDGLPLIAHVIERLKDQVDDIVISANAELETYEQFGFKVVPDLEDSKGPLSGIKAAAEHVKHDQVFITACDMPYLAHNLIDELRDEETSNVVAESNKGIEPLMCTVDREALNQIATCLNQDNYSVMNWLRRVDAKTKSLVHLGPETFYNINTLEELKSSSESWKLIDK